MDIRRSIAACLVVFLAACAGADPATGGAGGQGGTPAGTGGSGGGFAGGGGGGGQGGSVVETVPASSREVRFASAAPDAFEHVGTLQVPAHTRGEKLPAVILAHGSGASDRDGPSEGQLAMTFGFTILKFVEIGQALEDAGFVVLRFDKRSCGPFNGCADNGYKPTHMTIDTLIQDVEGGLAFLAEQPEVDGERLFFIGHSLGASYVPVIMRDHPEVRAGAMLAGGFHSIDHSLDFQADKLEEVYRATGQPESMIAANVEPVRTAAEELRALRDGTFEGTTILGGSIDLWASWLRLDDEAPVAAAALDRPMLILSGDYDWNIPPEETEAWAEYLGPDTIHRTQILSCVTHALNCIAQPDWRRIRQQDIGGHVDERVIGEVVDFLLEHR